MRTNEMNLRNVKINLEKVEDRFVFQDIALDNGAKWLVTPSWYVMPHENPQHLEKQYLFIDERGLFEASDSKEYFDKKRL